MVVLATSLCILGENSGYNKLRQLRQAREEEEGGHS